MPHSIPVVPAAAITEILDVLKGYEVMKNEGRYERRHVEQYLDHVQRELIRIKNMSVLPCRMECTLSRRVFLKSSDD